MSQAPSQMPGLGQEQPLAVQKAKPIPSVVDSPLPEVTGADHSSLLAEDYLIPHLDADVMSYFAPEAQEYLEHLEADLLRVDKNDRRSNAPH
jgi:chemosensory pili system protein ChpA (sensor histidine kinase/response regulator)